MNGEIIITNIQDTAGNQIVKDKKVYPYNDYNKKFMEKNKEKIMEKQKCEICCGSYTYFNKSKHLKSKKHLDLLNKLNNSKL